MKLKDLLESNSVEVKNDYKGLEAVKADIKDSLIEYAEELGIEIKNLKFKTKGNTLIWTFIQDGENKEDSLFAGDTDSSEGTITIDSEPFRYNG